MKGKRFLFSIISMICVSVTTVILSFDADTYFKLVTAIVGVYTLSQAYTDIRNGGKNDKTITH